MKRKSGVLIQWKNTDAVIDWFQQIENKNNYYFISCDIKEFYPSISENLLKEAVDWASTITPISDDDKELFISAKTSFLYYDGTVWKKQDQKTFI